MNVDLGGKVALITGSSRGIGRGCAVAVAGAGADVAVNYYSHPEDAEETAEQVRACGRRALILQADVADRDAVECMVQGTVDGLGGIDIAVCNSYYSKRQPFLDIEVDEMRRTHEVTFWGAFHTAQLSARQMVEQGRGGALLFISSVLAQIPMPTSLPYNSAKAGLEQMVLTIANEMSPHRIRANAIQPGWTDTPGERQYATEAEMAAGAHQLPWGRLGTIEDMGTAAAFLCSDAADYITGATLRIDGGFSFRH